MRSLMTLLGTMAVVSGLRDIQPGFNVDYRTFPGSPSYRDQRLPDRELSRSFREPSTVQHQRQTFRDDAFRDYRQPFGVREDTMVVGFPADVRGGFKDDGRVYKDDNRDSFVEELRNFNVDARQLRDGARLFKDGIRGLGDETGPFRELRTFGDDSRTFREGVRHFRDDGPFRDERRSFRDEIRPYRDDYRTFRDEGRTYKDDHRHFEPPRNFRDELRSFRDEGEGFRDGRPFKEESGQFRNEARPFKEESGPFRNEARPFKEDRPFKEESGQFRNEARPFKEEASPFRNEATPFKEDRPFKEESGQFRNEARPFKEESGPFRNEARPFKEDRPFKAESGPFRNEARPFKEESVQFRNEPRPFKEESGPFRNEARPFKEDRPFKEESGPFRNEPSPFKEESAPFSNEPRPFKEESGPFRNEVRQFTDDSGSFKDEILFTQESQSLAGAHNRYVKEQENRQQLSFRGPTNYLKYGNHGLGFASVPSAVLPLEDSSSQGGSDRTRTELSKTIATQSPGTSSPAGSSDTKNQISVTVAPDYRSTPSQSSSGNNIDNNSMNSDRKNEKAPSLAVEASTSQAASTATTISTSGGSNVTPKVVFGTGSASMSNSPLVIGNVDITATSQRASDVTSLHGTKSSMHTGTSTNSYFPSDGTAEVPTALLNYIFKYQQPQETKMQYVYRQSMPEDSFNHIQTLAPSNHHQTAKYEFPVEFKIPTLSGIQQPGGTINYVPANGLSKPSYVNGNTPGLTLGGSYTTDGGATINFGRNVLQLDQGPQFPQLEQTQQQFTQIGQLGTPGSLNQLGQYGQFGQVEQTRSNNPFGQGGLQLQLGGFGGIDYSALSSNSETSRGSPGASLGIAKVGLSFAESLRPPAPTFTKVENDPSDKNLWEFFRW